MTLQLSHMSTRNQFGGYFVEKGYTGVGVEVGTHRGAFARTLLTDWNPGGLLICVDPWENQSEKYAVEQAHFLPGTQGRTKDHKYAAHYLDDYVKADRCRLWQMTSEQAANSSTRKTKGVDFVYLDGDHSYEGIKEDVAMWWPNIRAGGILAGHDFICPGPPGSPENWGRFIQPVVIAFAEKEGLDVFLICEEGGLPWSWYVEKPL